MNKLDHLKAATRLIDKIVSHRRYLHRTQKEGKPLTLNMQKTIVEIEYYKPTLWKSFDRMMCWLGQSRVKRNLEELIPSNKETWKTQLQSLIMEGNFLQGRTAKQTKIEFKINL